MLRRRRPPEARTAGPPASSNGASSMHVWWELGLAFGRSGALEVSATLEVVEPPTVERLFFWALQATFVDGASGRPVGTAHLGLQWHAPHPGSTAVNWGGYRPGGGELAAHAPSVLPSTTGNPNTRDFAWRPRTPYRLTIRADGTGTVTDADRSDGPTLVRRLDVGAGPNHLADPVVWSEVFADCDHPTTTVRWSALSPRPATLLATYQSVGDGGCTNTDTELHADGSITQRTNAHRTTPGGRLA